jgi:hypothetical protein
LRGKRGLAGLAGVVGTLAVAALAPTAAIAHPCSIAGDGTYTENSFLSFGAGAWGGSLPAIDALEHDCAATGTETFSVETTAAADPVQDAVSSFVHTDNLTPLGYSARKVPFTGTGNGVYNSDLAFKDNMVIAGTYEGFRIIDVTDKSNPTELVNYTGCNVGQGDVVVHGNILIRSWDAPASATSTCAGQLVGQGFEGIHIFDISNPASPQFIRALRFSQAGMPEGALLGCGSHTATAVPDDARGHLYIYNGGSSATCQGIDIFRIKISDPSDAVVLRRAAAGRQCHDNNVIMGTVNLAMCAGGNGLSVFSFDPALDPEAEGGIANPKLLWSKNMGVTTGHSGSFTYDGKLLVYGHEPGGGSAARCQATSTVTERTLFFLDPRTGDQLGTMLHPRPQTSRENCTWHNFNVVPTKKGYVAVVGSYQSGISVLDFSTPSAPREIAYADPAPLQTTPPEAPVTGIILGGDWSTYWHNGYIYESDIKRGVITWKLDAEETKRTSTFAVSNPQTQRVSYEQDLQGATIEIASPIDGGRFQQGKAVAADFSCADAYTGVESCVGTVADGAPMAMDTIGVHTFTVTATDNAGNVTTKEVHYMVNSTAKDTTAGGTVAATLALTLGAPASFGAFTPGVGKDYTATTTANVVSTAGDAALSVSDPGHLGNGAFSLPQPLQVTLSKATWTGPVSNDAVTLAFKQTIAATDPLRTGTYSKTLTFTLSTTNP